MMVRTKRFENRETKVIGLRVPKDIIKEIKQPLRDFADYYITSGNDINWLINEITTLRKFKEDVVREFKNRELTPEKFKKMIGG